MPEKKKPRDNDELMDAITELFDNVAPETPEEIDAFLIDSGYSPNELGEKFKLLAAEAFEQSPYNWRNRVKARMEKDKERYSDLKQEIPKGKDNLIDSIQNLIAGFPANTQGQLRLAHRNFEGQTENDLAALFMDLLFLKESPETEDHYR